MARIAALDGTMLHVEETGSGTPVVFVHSMGAYTALHVGLDCPETTLWDLEKRLRGFTVPLLVIVGDEDFPCLDGSLFLKRVVPTAGLFVVPRAGHTINN